MSVLDRLEPLHPHLRDWLDGGRSTGEGLTRGSGSPVGPEAFDVLLGTRLEELARLASCELGDGASGVGVYLDALPNIPGVTGTPDQSVQAVLEYLIGQAVLGRPWVDDGSVPTTLYVETTGDDDTGDGTVGSPYATIERAVRDIPVWARDVRTIQLGAGTFELPEVAAAWNRITVQGTKSVLDTREITSINSSSVSVGLELTLDGASFSGVDSEVGTLVKGVGGGPLNNRFGWIYENDAGTTVRISQDTPASTTFKVPAVGQDLELYDLETTLDIPEGCLFLACAGGTELAECQITGLDLQAISTDQVNTRRCLLLNRRLNVGGFGRILNLTSYLKLLGTNATLGMLTVLNQAQWFVNRGTVVDGAGVTSSTFAHIKTSNQSSIETDGEVVFQHFDDKGLDLHGTQLATRRVTAGSGHNEWRLRDFAEDGVVSNDGLEGLGSWLDLPDLYGDVGRFCVRVTANTHARLGASSSITTGFGPGTNEVSADDGATKTGGIELDGSRIFGGDPAPVATPDCERCVRVDFTYATASPLFITTQLASELIVQSDVVLTTAFDGATPALLLGSPATPGLVFDTLEIKPKKTGQWSSQEVIGAAGATTIQLDITPGGSGAGAGFVLLKLRT